MKENKSLQPKTSFRQRIILGLFGLSLFFVLLEVGLRLGGFVLLSMQEYRNNLSIREKGTYRILCLGESTTAGQYPPFLEEILNQRCIEIRFSVIDKGVPGIHSSTILSLLEDNLNKYNPDMVIVMMGLNDMITFNQDIKSIYSENSLALRSMPFFKYFRFYKFTEFLWLNILARLRQQGFHEIQENRLCVEDTSKLPKVESNDNNTVRQQSISRDISSNVQTGEPPLKEDVVSLINRGRTYQNQNRSKLAQECFKKVIALDPRSEAAYIELARSYNTNGQNIQAQESAKKAIEINPNNAWTYFELGGYYQQDQPEKAEGCFKKSIELDSKDDWLYTNLVWLYLSQGKLFAAEDLLKKILTLYPKSYWINSAIASIYREMGKLELAIEYEKKLKWLWSYYPSVTINNYHRFKKILDKRKITLVCVQYPVRSVKPLMQIFEGQGDIIFVDNEKKFKDALRQGSCRDYFTDMYGGDFGHCTEKGNRLLAENIANVILKEVFGK